MPKVSFQPFIAVTIIALQNMEYISDLHSGHFFIHPVLLWSERSLTH